MNWYLLFKTLHIVSFTAWMAGLFYLPRLFIYHTKAVSPEMNSMFKVMEYKLLRFIMNPSMISTFTFGICLIYQNGFMNMGKWIHIKLLLVLMLAGYHSALAKYRKDFYHDRNTKSERFYRFINEVPSVLLISIVALAVFKPF